MAGEAVIGALRADLILNTASLESGVSHAGRLLGDMNKSMMNTAGAAERSGNVFNGLRAKFDSTFAASKQYENSLKALERAHKQGLPDAQYLAAFDRLNNEFAQMASPLTEAQRETSRLAAEMDSLRGKYDPIYVATKRYDAAVAELSSETARAAMSDEARAQALARLKNQLELTKLSMGTMGATAQQAGFHSTNLFFQFQDISTMLASGQSPFLLAMQQGPQIVGIFEQIKNSGGGLGKTMLSALGALVSPLSLITVGAIAAGGALIYWLTGADEKAKTLDESLGDLSSAVGDLKSITDLLSDTDSSGLTEQYGALTQETLNLIEAQRQFAIMDAAQSAGNAIAAAAGAMNGWITTELDGIRNAFETTNDNARYLQRLMDGVQAASTPEEALAATSALRAQIESTVGPLSGLKGEAGAFARGLVEAELNLKQAVVQSDRAEAAMAGARDAANGTAGAIGNAANNAARLTSALGGARTALAGISEDVADVNRQLKVEIDAIKSGVDASIAVQRDQAMQEMNAAIAAAGGVGGADLEGIAARFKVVNDGLDEQSRLIKEKAAALDGASRAADSVGVGSGRAAAGVDKLTESLEAAGKEAEDSPLLQLGDKLVDSLVGGGNPFAVLESHFKSTISNVLKEALRAKGGIGGLLSGVSVPAAGGGGGIGAGLGSSLMGAMGGPIGIGLGILSIFGAARQRRQEAARRQAQERASITGETDRLGVRLLELQGRNTEALARARKLELDATKSSLRPLVRRKQALEDEVRILDQRRGLEEQLWQLQGDQAKLDKRWLETIDPANRALADQILAMRRAEEATASMNQALSDLAPEMFATALDFARARGAAASGLRLVGGTAVSAASVTAAVAQAVTSSPADVALQMTMAKILNILQGVQSADGDALRMEAV